MLKFSKYRLTWANRHRYNPGRRAISSVGQSASLTPKMSGVRVPHRPPCGTCACHAHRTSDSTHGSFIRVTVSSQWPRYTVGRAHFPPSGTLFSEPQLGHQTCPRPVVRCTGSRRPNICHAGQLRSVYTPATAATADPATGRSSPTAPISGRLPPDPQRGKRPVGVRRLAVVLQLVRPRELHPSIADGDDAPT